MVENLSYTDFKILFDRGFPEKVISAIKAQYQQHSEKIAVKELLLLARAYSATANFTEAIKIIQSIPQSPSLPLMEQCEMSEILCTSYDNIGKFGDARIEAEKLITLAEPISSDFFVLGKMWLSDIIACTGDVQEAIQLLQSTLDKYEDQCTRSTLAVSYIFLGNHYGVGGFQQKAIIAYKKAYEIALQENIIPVQLLALNNLGASYDELDDYDTSYQYFVRCYNVSPNKMNPTYILTTNNIALNLVKQGKVHDALEHYNEALALARESQNKRLQSFSLCGLANVNLIFGEYTTTKDNLNEAEIIAQEINDRDLRIRVLHYRSKLYARLGKFDIAIKLLKQSLAIKEENNIIEGLLVDYSYLIEYYLELNDLITASDLRETLKAYIQHQGTPNAQQWLLSADANIAYKNNDFGTALMKFQQLAVAFDLKEIREFQLRFCLKIARISLLIALFQESLTETQYQINIAYDYVIKTISMAEEMHDLHYLLEGQLSRSTIELAKGELVSAIQTLSWAQAYAVEKKLSQYSQRISRRLAEIKNLESLENSKDAVMLTQFWQRQGLKSAIEGVREALSYTDPLIAAEKLSITNIVFYRFTQTGPDMFYSEKPVEMSVGLSAGVFLYTSIGQGGNYRTGLYGPLPWGKNENEVALIHSQQVFDRQSLDPRMKMKNFVIIALITQQGKTHLLDRQSIEKILTDGLNKIKDLSTVTTEELIALIAAVHNLGI